VSINSLNNEVSHSLFLLTNSSSCCKLKPLVKTRAATSLTASLSAENTYAISCNSVNECEQRKQQELALC
jgi:hypothetical protein